MKCKNCEHFKRVYPPMGLFDSGLVKCEKYNMIYEYTSTRSLNKLTCVEKEGGTSDNN